jgi:hypothetical protein
MTKDLNLLTKNIREFLFNKLDSYKSNDRNVQKGN